MVTILHISDLHFTRDAAMHTMREVLKQQARQRAHDKPRGEKLLVVTGDFHNFWAPDYADAIKFMGELIEAMDIDPVQDVFVIPGNHDVADDKVLEPILKDKIPDWKKHKAAALKMIGSGDFDFLGWRMEAFVPYCAFVRELGVYPSATDPIADTTPAHVHVRRWRNKLNVLHLNTTLVADGSAKDNQLADVNTATDPELWNAWYRDDLPTIALGHNSFYDLQKKQRDALAAMFAQRNVSAYLCGDTHKVELDAERQTINIGVGQMPIPNVVSAKGVADLSDNYSDFGYYWHEWDEDSDRVEALFYRWRSEYLAEVAPEGIPVRYRMRRKVVKPKLSNGSVLSKLASVTSDRQDPDAELITYLSEVLKRRRDSHPSFQLLKVDEIDNRLYPKVDNIIEAREYREIPAQALIPAGEDGAGEGCCPVWDIIRRSWSDITHRNVVITGEGGIGKTVALFSVTRSVDGMPVPSLYVPMYELVSKDGDILGLSDHIEAKYEEYAEAIKKLATRSWGERPQLLVLLDGFNEISYALREPILNKINGWYESHLGVQLVAVSRPMDGLDLSLELAGNPIPVKLVPLDDVTVEEYLREAGRRVPARRSTIWGDLRYPLFLNLYIKTGRLKGRAPAGYPLLVMESDSGGSLIWNYLQRELLRHSRDASEKAEDWVLRCAITNEYILPYLAYQMVSAQSMDVSFDRALEWTREALDRLEKNVLPKHLKTIWRIYRKKHGGTYPSRSLFSERVWLDTVMQDTGTLVTTSQVRDNGVKQPEDDTYVFMHQNFRDCLAGLHLVNQAELVDGGILPEVWCHTQSHLSLRYAAELMDSQVLERFWNTNREAKPRKKGGSGANRTIVYNLLYLCNHNERLLEETELSFSGMELRGLSLARYLGKDKLAVDLPQGQILSIGTQIDRSISKGRGHMDSVRCVVVLPDGFVVSGSADNTLLMWNPSMNECLREFDGHMDWVMCVAALPDGLVVSGSADNTLRVWDPSTGECLRVCEGHADWVMCVAALSGGLVVSGSADGALRVWNTTTGECLHPFEGHAD